MEKNVECNKNNLKRRRKEIISTPPKPLGTDDFSKIVGQPGNDVNLDVIYVVGQPGNGANLDAIY